MRTAFRDIGDEQEMDESQHAVSESDNNASQRSLSSSPAPSDSDQELDYEARRAKQIAENTALLEALGLSGISLAPSSSTSNIAKRKTQRPNMYKQRKQQPIKVVDYGTSSLPIKGRTQFVSAVLVPVLARRTRRAVYPANYTGKTFRRHSSAMDVDTYELSSESEWEMNSKGTARKRRNNLGIRHVGSKIYDSVNGTTCHQCRQKTLCPKIHCNAILYNGSDCTLMFCKSCLLVRYGESFSGHRNWLCPKCRGICNCSICLRKIGAPTCSMNLYQLQDIGFESIQDMLQQQGFWNTRTTARLEPIRRERLAHKRKRVEVKETSDEPPILRKSKSVPLLQPPLEQDTKRERSISGDADKEKTIFKRLRSDKLEKSLIDNLSRKSRRQSAPGKVSRDDLEPEASKVQDIIVVDRIIDVAAPLIKTVIDDLEESRHQGTLAVDVQVDETEDSVVAKKIADAEHLRNLLSSTLSEIAEIKCKKSASPEGKRKQRKPVKIKLKMVKKVNKAPTLNGDGDSSDSGIGSTEDVDNQVNHDFLLRTVRDPEAEAIRQRVRDVEYLQASGSLDVPLPSKQRLDEEIPAMMTPELKFDDLFQV